MSINLNPNNFNNFISQLLSGNKIKNENTSKLTSSFNPVHVPLTKPPFHERTKSFLINADLEAELEELIGKKEHDIEELNDELEALQQDFSKEPNDLSTLDKNEQIASKNKNKVEKAIDFLQIVMPDEVVNNLGLEKIIEKYSNFHLGQSLITVSESGFQGLALIIKSKLLKQSKEILKEIVNYYHKVHLPIPEQLLEWNKRLKIEEANLKEESLTYKLTITSRSAQVTKLGAGLMPILQASRLGSNALELLGGLGSILGAILSFLDLKKNIFQAKAFSQWISDFQQFNKTSTNTGKINLINEETFPPLKKEESTKKISNNITLEEFDPLIEQAKNVFEKRELLLEKKLHQLRPEFEKLKPKLLDLKKNHLITSFKAILKETTAFKDLKMRLNTELGIKLPPNISSKEEVENFYFNIKDKNLEPTNAFTEWFEKQEFNADSLLKTYIDHMETIEIVVKNSLKEMTKKKFDLEKETINLRMISSSLLFTMTSACLIISIVLGVMGLLSIPVGGLGFALIGLSFSTTALSVGLFGVGYYFSLKSKPSSITFFEKIKLLIKTLQNNLREYQFLNKQKQLILKARILYQVHKTKHHHLQLKLPSYHKALKDYQKAKLSFKKSKNNFLKINSRVKEIEADYLNRDWQDFVRYGKMIENEKGKNDSFSTIEALGKALESSDPSLLTDETKALLKYFLNIDLNVLKKDMAQQSEEIKNAIQRFFGLDFDRLVEFIKNQKKV